MGVVELSDAVHEVIRRKVAEGLVESEAAFLEQAVLSHAGALEAEHAMILAAIDEGMADYEAGRYETINGPEELSQFLDGILAEVIAEYDEEVRVEQEKHVRAEHAPEVAVETPAAA